MFLEYVTDMTFVLVSLIGGIIAILYVYVRKTKKRS
ncbi:EYxxD motif small membrane protein [Bacillus spongiae]|uniref:EYxxD motif small membrane protein n=1 Tax=Bacillus spongiae TaxID=2683610 RepID=A0ABU8HDE0_9BACI